MLELGKNCGVRAKSRLNPRVDQENAVAVYRLAPTVVLRSAGAAFVLLAVVVLALSVVTGLAGWSSLVVGVVAGLGLLGVAGGAWWAATRACPPRHSS